MYQKGAPESSDFHKLSVFAHVTFYLHHFSVLFLLVSVLLHCKKKRVNLTKLWSPQLQLSDHLHVVIKECAHKCKECAHKRNPNIDLTLKILSFR